jgi:simple sugar transport system ATP-binding protein
VTPRPVLEATKLTKTFGTIVALNGVDFTVSAGEVVALVGDNGAGKSTLVKILSGVEQPDRGAIFLDGRQIELPNPHASRSRGIETIYQDLALAPHRDVTQNLFLGRELTYGNLLKPLSILNRPAMAKMAEKHLADLGITIPKIARMPIARLSGGQQQAVAIARAASWATKVLFMDEPTAALGVTQSRSVLTLAKRLAERGIGVVLITHIMPHVMEIADRLVVLRHGRKVADMPTKGVTTDMLVRLIVGFDPGQDT